MTDPIGVPPLRTGHPLIDCALGACGILAFVAHFSLDDVAAKVTLYGGALLVIFGVSRAIADLVLWLRS